MIAFADTMMLGASPLPPGSGVVGAGFGGGFGFAGTGLAGTGFAGPGLDGAEFASPSASASIFEAGRISLRDPSFLPQSFGPNAAAEVGNLEMVRRRRRYLLDNNPLIDGGVETTCDKIVGNGITLEPNTGDEDLDDALRELFHEAAERVDPERQTGLWESQRLYVRELFAGDVLVYRPIATEIGRFGMGPAIELIDAERLPMGLTGTFGPEKNPVRQGVEYDRRNRVVAYHVLVEHPTDGGDFLNPADAWTGGLSPGLGSSGSSGWGGGWGRTVRIPIGLAELSFPSRRIAQLRGVPRAVGVMTAVRLEETYLDYAMRQALAASALSVIIKTKNAPPGMFRKQIGKGPDGKTREQDVFAVDAAGNPVLHMGGGNFTFIPDGHEPMVVNPSLPGPTFESTQVGMQRRMARGMRVPYSTFAGNTSRSSFSSMRGEQIDGQDAYNPLKRFVFEHHTREWWNDVVRWGMLSGRIRLTAAQRARVRAGTLRLEKCVPRYPGFRYSNPSQEAAANEIDIRAGVSSVPIVCAEKGEDWRQVVRDRVAVRAFELKEYAKAGIAPPADATTSPIPPAPPDPADDEGPDGAPTDQEDANAE